MSRFNRFLRRFGRNTEKIIKETAKESAKEVYGIDSDKVKGQIASARLILLGQEVDILAKYILLGELINKIEKDPQIDQEVKSKLSEAKDAINNALLM